MDKVELDFTLVEKIINQLINSDGMEVTNDYLIQQKIYYIDNVGMIEELEELLITHLFNELSTGGSVNRDDVLNRYSPKYINYDKLLDKLERDYKHNTIFKVEKHRENTLNEYL